MFKKTLISAGIVLVSGMATAADVANSNLQVNFESAHLQGAGNQITMLKVPVTNKETGETKYFDMSAVFAVDKKGALTFKNISSVKSVAFGSANQLVAGHYKDQHDCNWYVDGPSAGSNGRLSWSMMRSGSGCNEYAVQVMSGSAKNNELIVGFNAYQTLKDREINLNYGSFDGDYAVSAAQTGKMITVIRYGSSAEPKDSWSLRNVSEITEEVRKVREVRKVKWGE